MLKDRSLQSLIADTPGGFQGLVVAGIGFLVTALLHEDFGRLPKAGDSVTVASQCTVNANALLCRAEGLVKASCSPQRIGEIAQRCGQVVQLLDTGFSPLFGLLRLACEQVLDGLGRRQVGGLSYELLPGARRLSQNRDRPLSMTGIASRCDRVALV